MTEAEWQQQFLDLAHAYGWRHMHVRRSIGKGRRWTTATNVTGWPDLTLWHERQQRVLFVELKSADGQPSPEQVEVLASLARAVPGGAHLFRPDDLEAARSLLAGVRTYPQTSEP